jgi:flagellar motility protein MotE (MotC chaperone)
MATNNAVQAAPPRPSPAGPSTGSQHSPLEAQQDDNRSTTEADAAAPDDLDPAAFLKSVRELSEKREREDNERYRRLEEEIEKGRSQRLARREGEWTFPFPLLALLEDHI